jgi:hypothetical protein
MISSKTITSLPPVIKSLMVRKGFQCVPTLTKQPYASVKVTMQPVPHFAFHERQSGERVLILTGSQLPRTVVTATSASFMYSLSLLSKRALQPNFCHTLVTRLIESGYSMAFAIWLFMVNLKSITCMSRAFESRGAATCRSSLSSPTPKFATLKLQNQALITCRCKGNNSSHFSCSQYYGNTILRASMISLFGNLFSN